FHTGLEGQRAHAVLVQRPRDTLVALILVVDDVILPAHFRFADVQDQIIRGLPDLAEGGADVLDRALVDGVVRQIQLRRPHPFADDLHQLLHLCGWEGQLGDLGRGIRQSAAPVSSATMATSLSPRPLKLMRMRSSEARRLFNTHAMAWALSSAGRMPSSRERAAKASRAS